MPGDPVAGTPGAAIEPQPTGGPPNNWPHRPLYDRVLAALHALPSFFTTSLNISGVRVTDLHTLNSALGASIEQSVVENLNALRAIWDPDKRYQLYSFVRQNQVFPDVRLQTTAPKQSDPIIMGIELKGWFALAKEGEPSFRYKVSPNVCAPADLLVVFPWMLDEVISGKPRLMEPFIAEAKWAAIHRNYYWVSLRGAKGAATSIQTAAHTGLYPKKGDQISDEALKDFRWKLRSRRPWQDHAAVHQEVKSTTGSGDTSFRLAEVFSYFHRHAFRSRNLQKNRGYSG